MTGNLGDLVVGVQADISRLRQGMNRARQIVQSASSAMRGFLRRLMLPIMAVGAAITAYLYTGFRDFLSLEQQMFNLNATVSRVGEDTEATMRGITDTIWDISMATGIGLDDVTEAMNSLLQMVDDPAKADYLVPFVIDWAHIADKPLDEAVEDIYEAFEGDPPPEILLEFGLDPDLEGDEAWDAIKEALKEYGGIAEEYAEETIGGNLKRIWNNIKLWFQAMVEEGSGEILKALQGLADTTEEIARSIRDGEMPGVFKYFEEIIADTINAIDTLIQWLFGLNEVEFSDVRSAFNDLYETVTEPLPDGIKDFIDGIRDLFEGLEIDDIKTFASNFAKATAVIAAAGPAITVLNLLASPLKLLGSIISGILGGKLLLTLYDRLSHLFYLIAMNAKVPIKIRNISAALGTLFAVAQGHGPLEALKIAIQRFGMVLSGLKAPIAIAIAVLVSMYLAFRDNWGGARDAVVDAWESIKSTFSDVGSSLGRLVDSLRDLSISIGDLFASIIGVFSVNIEDWEDLVEHGADAISTSLGGLKEAIGSLFRGIVEVIEWAVNTIGNVLGLLVETIDTVVVTVTAIIDTLAAIFRGDFGEIVDIWRDWWGDMNDIGLNMIDYFKGIIDDLLGVLWDLLVAIKDILLGILDFLFGWIPDLLGWGDDTEGALDGIKDGIAGIFQGLYDNTKTVLTGLVHTLMFGFLGDTEGWGDDVINWIGDFVLDVGRWFVDLYDTFKDGLENIADFMFGWLDGDLTAFIRDKGSWFTDLISDVGDWFDSLLAGFREGLGNVADFMFGWIDDDLADFARDKGRWFTGLIGDVGGWLGDLLGSFTDGLEDIADFMFGWIDIDLGEIISDISSWFTDLISDVGGWLGDLLDAFTDGLGEIADFLFGWIDIDLKDWGNTVSNWFSSIFSIDIFDAIGDVYESIKDRFNDIKDWLWGWFSGNTLTEWGDSVVSWFSNEFDTGIFGAIGDVYDSVVERFNDIRSWLDDTWLGDIKGFGDSVINWFSGTFDPDISSAVSGVRSTIESGFNGVTNWLDDTFVADIARSGQDVIGSLTNSIQDKWESGIQGDSVTNWFSGKISSLADSVSSTAGEISDSASDIVDNLRDGIDSAWDGGRWSQGVGDWFADKVSGLSGSVSNVVSDMQDAGTSIVDNLKDGIDDEWGGQGFYGYSSSTGIQGWFQDKVSGLRDVVDDASGRLRSGGRGIVNAIRDGADSRWDSFSSWFDRQLDNLADLLPSSDAKKGPLSNITAQGRGLITALLDGMKLEELNLYKEMQKIASIMQEGLPSELLAPNVNGPDAGLMGNAGAKGKYTIVNVNVKDGVYAEDRALDSLAERIGEKFDKKVRGKGG